MRIDDVDPDERDDRPRRRGLLALGAVTALTVGVAAAVAIGNRGDDTPVADSTVPVTEAPPVTDEEPPEIDVNGPDLDAFPDWGSDYVGQRLDVLYERVTEAGIRVALQDSGEWGEMVFEEMAAAPEGMVIDAETGEIGFPGGVPTTVVGGWVPETWCSPIGGFRLTMSFQDAVGIGNGQRYAEARSPLTASLFSSGYAEAHPFRVLVMQVADEVLAVSATWADGASDSAAPNNGWLVLATPGEPSGEFSVTVETPDGVDEIGWQDLPRDGDDGWSDGCVAPPPELPPPGEQPADADAAAAEVEQAFEILWDTDIPFEDKGELVLDNTEGVADAVDAVMNGGFADAARTARHTIVELVFVSPDEAWFRYDIDTTAGNFNDRFGIAYRIDGVWKIARAVICQDLALAGGQCFPPTENIQPPAG